MRQWSIRMFCFLVLLLVARRVFAEPPPYLVLSSPHVPAHASPTEVRGRGTAHPRYTSGYAYGWFGVQHRRHHWSRHFGYYRNYREWTGR